MTVLITGGAGFLGTRLIRALLADPAGRVDRIVCADAVPSRVGDPRVESRMGSVADAAFVRGVVGPDVAVVCHLAAVLSGQSEAEFDLGMRINVDGTRGLLEACRALARPPRFVFSSTTAVFGGPLPPLVPEDMAVLPQSSYGAEKAIAEHLVAEYSRRGFVDGVACRVPTVCVRPGAPNSAMSSFVSGIIREPLAGLEAVCPVPLDLPIWIASPDVVTANLVHAVRLDTATLEGRRVVNLPGLSVTPAEMLDSLARLGGAEARSRVRCEPDPRIAAIVNTWPAAIDVRRALALGFVRDRDIDAVIRQYLLGVGPHVAEFAPPDADSKDLRG
jgi:nucleoside-diphosphate-sugar epimerase